VNIVPQKRFSGLNIIGKEAVYGFRQERLPEAAVFLGARAHSVLEVLRQWHFFAAFFRVL
jgi:hypothetical protein